MKRMLTVLFGMMLLLVGVMPAAAQGEKDIVTIAVEDGRFTTLVSALQATGLDEALAGEGPFTVFAPTDDAFAKLPEGTLESLDNETLAEILKYHVVSGSVMAADAVAMAGQSAATLQGEEINIAVDGDTVKINDASVIIPDIEASNGVIHVIDSVLLPPSIVAAMSDDGAGAGESSTQSAPTTMPTTGGTQLPVLPLAAVAVGILLALGGLVLRPQSR